jgi:hypothetical protein
VKRLSLPRGFTPKRTTADYADFTDKERRIEHEHEHEHEKRKEFLISA